jgi:hypothetical protein
LIGAVFLVIGVVLFTDFKGAATFHVKASIRSGETVRRIPPWRWLPERTDEERFHFAMRLERFIGASFALAGLAVVLISAVQLL